MNNDWQPKEIKAKELEEKMKSKKIAVPTYQRGIVWSENMQRDLIDSIKNGYPFGSLVIFNYEDERPWLLIDGLQRSMALFKFINEPSKFFAKDDINNEIINNLCSVLNWDDASDSQKESIKSKIVDWIKSFKTSSEVRNIDPYECAEMIANEFVRPGKSSNDHEYLRQIKDTITPIFNNFKALCSIVEDRRIPYIEITGDDKNLDNIFFRINDRGKKLSKENILAATWTNHAIKITNEKLLPFIDIVAKRYDEIQSSGANIYDYDHQSFIDSKVLDVFELCYAFGKYIKQQYPDLFGNLKDIITAEPIGFTLLNACLMGSKETLPKMNEKLKNTFNTDEIINAFVIKVLSCIKYIDDILAPVTKFKSNKRLGKTPLHTDLQICSIIASTFRLKHISVVDNKYQFNLSNTTREWNRFDNLIKKNLLKKYLSDILNNIWAGHGDNTLDNILHNDAEIYTREISSSDLRSTLYNWYNMYKAEHREYLEKDISSPSSADKLLLNLIYSDKFSAAMQLNEDKFDIEHLLPKKLAESILRKFKGELKLPLSSIGNLCLLPEYTNRKKKDKIIYEDNEYIDKLGNRLSITDLEKNYTFTKLSDLSWAKNMNLTKDDIESSYNVFIDKRFEKIVSMVIDNLYSTGSN